MPKKSKETVEDVVAAHVTNAIKNYNNPSEDEEFSVSPPLMHIDEDMNQFSPKSSPDIDKENFYTSSPVIKKHQTKSNLFQQSSNILANNATTNVFDTLSNQELRRQLIDAKNNAQIWKDKYYNLLHSESYPLTEKTGQKVISLLSQLGNVLGITILNM